MSRITATGRIAKANKVAITRVPVVSLGLPGSLGNSASTPDSSVLDITGSIDIIMHLSSSQGRVSGGNKIVLAKYDPTTNQRSYQLQLLTTGFVRLSLSLAGTAGVDADSTVVLPNIYKPIWIRATWQQSDGRVQFFTSTSSTLPTTWTQLGANITTAIASIFAGTTPLCFGAASSNGTTNFFIGNIYRAIIKNGIDGTSVFDANFTTQTVGAVSFTESSLNAATVTVNQSGSSTAKIAGRINLV
jgi:hypothetical protein